MCVCIHMVHIVPISICSYSSDFNWTNLTDKVVSFSVSPALHPSRNVQMSIPHQNSPSPGTVNQSTLTGPLQRASPQYLSSSGPPQQSCPPPLPYLPDQPLSLLLSQFLQYTHHMHSLTWGPGVYPHHPQGPGMSQEVPNLQSIMRFQTPSHPSQPRTCRFPW